MTAARIDTSLVRCLAVLLITNSHLDALYPDPRLGTGGALGNTLFFLLSGYGLAISLNSGAASQEPFLNYWLRRLSKIYPVLWVVTLAVVVIGGGWHSMTMSDWFFKLLWPIQYWFVCAIVLFYALFYWFGKFSEKVLLLSILLLGVPYFLCYFFLLDLNHFSIETSLFKWIVYFQIMLLGAWLSKQTHQPSPLMDASLMVSCVLIFYGLRIALAWLNLWELQFLLHLILFPFALYTFRFFSAPAVLNFTHSLGFYPVAVFLAGLTLEIYLVQVPLIPVIAKQHWTFPIGWLIALVLIPIFAFVANKITAELPIARLLKRI